MIAVAVAVEYYSFAEVAEEEVVGRHDSCFSAVQPQVVARMHVRCFDVSAQYVPAYYFFMIIIAAAAADIPNIVLGAAAPAEVSVPPGRSLYHPAQHPAKAPQQIEPHRQGLYYFYDSHDGHGGRSFPCTPECIADGKQHIGGKRSGRLKTE